ncbi:unannotated protein [freshwater metagenome]|uniref:Unannotated protein n=1 Tax=freshwater metagenome TaxID=449393 RepID=A0A6J6MTS2_9ZZZZ
MPTSVDFSEFGKSELVKPSIRSLGCSPPALRSRSNTQGNAATINNAEKRPRAIAS